MAQKINIKMQNALINYCIIFGIKIGQTKIRQNFLKNLAQFGISGRTQFSNDKYN